MLKSRPRGGIEQVGVIRVSPAMPTLSFPGAFQDLDAGLEFGRSPLQPIHIAVKLPDLLHATFADRPYSRWPQSIQCRGDLSGLILDVIKDDFLTYLRIAELRHVLL